MAGSRHETVTDDYFEFHPPTEASRSARAWLTAVSRAPRSTGSLATAVGTTRGRTGQIAATAAATRGRVQDDLSANQRVDVGATFFR